MALKPSLLKFTTATPILANYDYTDADEGTGTIIFYPGTGTDKNILRKKAFYSNEVISSSTGPTAATKELDLDFDIQFNTPKTIKGQALITVPVGISMANAINITSAYVIANIIHYDGTSETNIGTNTSDTLSLDGCGVSSEDKSQVFCIEIDLTDKLFASGDILRINLQLYCSVNGNANAGAISIGHDPKNRTEDLPRGTGTINPTICEAHIPFKLDI